MDTGVKYNARGRYKRAHHLPVDFAQHEYECAANNTAGQTPGEFRGGGLRLYFASCILGMVRDCAFRAIQPQVLVDDSDKDASTVICVMVVIDRST